MGEESMAARSASTSRLRPQGEQPGPLAPTSQLRPAELSTRSRRLSPAQRATSESHGWIRELRRLPGPELRYGIRCTAVRPTAELRGALKCNSPEWRWATITFFPAVSAFRLQTSSVSRSTATGQPTRYGEKAATTNLLAPSGIRAAGRTGYSS